MSTLSTIFLLIFFTNRAFTMDFYLGMFKNNDLLVAQDMVYKNRVPFGYAYATYGRSFKCPLSYLRITDRLGDGAGLTAQIIRGGLLKKLVVVRIRSSYNRPISATVHAGCPYQKPTEIPPGPTSKPPSGSPSNGTTSSGNNGTTHSGDVTGNSHGTSESGGGSTGGGVTTPAPE